MKKLLIATNILFLSIIFYQSCAPARVAIPSFPLINNTYCTSCTQDLVGHRAAEFIDVVSRYKKTHYDIINHDAIQYYGSTSMPTIVPTVGQLSYDDARAVWFPLDTLKKFICNIEKYSDKFNVHSPNLGVRFYYATYPGNFSAYSQRSGQHTIFMSPTVNVKDEAVDFDPHLTANLYTAAGSTGPIPYQYMADLMNPASPQELMFCGPPASNTPIIPYPSVVSNTTATRFFWNNGNLCPTNCPTSSPQNYNTLNRVDAINPQGLTY